MQSFHEQIITAARNNDQEALSQVLSLSFINVLDRNSLSPAGLLSSIGDIASAEFLITNGASINLAVYGAAFGGYQAYADALILREASIDSAVRGAAQGGHQAYSDALIGRGASIDLAVLHAAQGGHQAYADTLIGCGASIDLAVQGAAQGGHQAYADALIWLGASIDWAVRGAACAGLQVYSNALHRRKPDLIKRRENIASLMLKDKLSFPEALLATDPDPKIACSIILYLAMRPNSKTLPLASYLIPDVWGIVLDYATPMKLSIEDKKRLGNDRGDMLFTMDRFLLNQDLRAYANGPNPQHKDRALSMALAVAKTTNKGDFDKLLSEQVLIINGKNPRSAFSFFKIGSPHLHRMSKNPTKDGFQAIIEEHADTTGASLPSIKPCDCASAQCSGACQDPSLKSAP